MSYASAWNSMQPDNKRVKRQTKIAADNKACKNQATRRYIGKPGGTGAGKQLTIPVLPVTRFSVLPK